MWKRVCFMTVFLLGAAKSQQSLHDVIRRVITQLEPTLDYISSHYEKINVDCLFGVVLAGAILDDTLNQAGPYKDQCRLLKLKTNEIYTKTLPLMKRTNYWNNFASYMVVPELWSKHLKFKTKEFRNVYAIRTKVDDLFSDNYTEGLSDHCLGVLINSTLKDKIVCSLDTKCQQLLKPLDEGSGYILTHKLLLLQVTRIRRCKIHPKTLATAVKKLCNEIYTEVTSVDFFIDLDEVFDLFLEQTLLCGYEGFADFLQPLWLTKILNMQHDSGCFPVAVQRSKRETHVWKDGCADHSTGLGAAVLSLYLNYLIGNSETLHLTSDWV